MGYAIVIIVALFLIGRKLDNSWLQAICFTGILVTGTCLFALLSFHPVICIICAIILTIVLCFLAIISRPSTSADSESTEKKQTATSQSPRKPAEPSTSSSSYAPSAEVTALVDETIDIVNEIFDIAGLAHLLSDIDYTGKVLIMPYEVRNANKTYCISILMLEVSELEESRRKHIRWKDNPDNHSKNAMIYSFAWKYRNNYDPSHHCYEIKTKATVRLSKHELPKLEAHIKEQIIKRCKMAMYSGDILYHKGIYDINH